jgi:hypothetical protein
LAPEADRQENGTGRHTMDVEIKVNFDAAQIDRAKQVFGLDRESKERSIWFGEIVTGRDGGDALPLLARGVILRVRATKKNSGDVTLKLRGPDGCIDVPAWTKRVDGLDDAKIEGDWADRRLVSASLTAKSDKAGREDLAAVLPPIESLMSEEQKTLARELLIPLDDVKLLGPITANKWEHEHDGDIDAEEWTVDHLQFLEISIVATGDPEQAQEDLLKRVRAADLTIAQTQRPKTTQVLQHLAGRPG